MKQYDGFYIGGQGLAIIPAQKSVLPSNPRSYPREWIGYLNRQPDQDWNGYLRMVICLMLVFLAAGRIHSPQAFIVVAVLSIIIAVSMFIWYLAASHNPKPDERLLQEGIEVHAICSPLFSTDQHGNERKFIQYEYGDGDDYYSGRIEFSEFEKSLTVLDSDQSKRLVLLVSPEHTWVHFIVPKQ